MGQKLWIVGNGFDIGHGINSRYVDFKKYLKKEIIETIGEEEFYNVLGEIPPESPARQIMGIKEEHGYCLADKIQEKKVIYWIINDADPAKTDEIKLWSEFEYYLGQLDFKKLLDNWGNSEESIHCLYETIGDIQGIFFDWIDSIEINAKIKSTYDELMDRNSDYVITFNYTETLEMIYKMNASNICYIHGRRETDKSLIEKKKTSIFGKDNCRLELGFDRKQVDAQKYDDIDNNIKSVLITTYMDLIKSTDDIIRRNADFFEKIAESDITDVFSVGYSFSDVDIPYVEEVCKAINKLKNPEMVEWHLCNFDDENRRKGFEKRIKESGFKGSVVSFQVND